MWALGLFAGGSTLGGAFAIVEGAVDSRSHLEHSLGKTLRRQPELRDRQGVAAAAVVGVAGSLLNRESRWESLGQQ